MSEEFLFLSHAGEEVTRARELAQSLRSSGIPVWLDADDLRPGDRWMEAIEHAMASARAFAIYVGRLGVQRWVDRELRLALTRNVDDPAFRIIPLLGEGAALDRLPAFLRQHHCITLAQAASDRTVAARIRELLTPASSSAGRPQQQTPFRGLERFEAADSIFFFGRDRAIEELIERTRTSSVVAVVGASGVGKSSLLRAGLLPALFRGRHGVSTGAWRASIFRPGDDVVREMASALPQLKPEATDAERLDLRAACLKHLESTGDLYGVLSVITPEGSNCVLVVDQFEELVTMNDPARRKQFVDLVTASLNARGDRKLHIVLGLRADFLSGCWQIPGLVPLLNDRTYLIPPMDAKELTQVISGPLDLIGGRVEAGLQKVVLTDLGSDPGRLPLLQHALLQLWSKSVNGILSHAAYEEIGGVSGALRNHAEKVFLDLSEADRRVARFMFLRMVRVVPQARPTRRRVSREELERFAGGPESLGRVLAQLIAGRLVVIGTSAAAPSEDPVDQTLVEIVHETLLENWERYTGWIDEEMGALHVESDLRAAADQWSASAKDSAYLLTGSRLRAAERWAAEHHTILTETLLEFLSESAKEFDTISRLRSSDTSSNGMGWRLRADAAEWAAAESHPEFLYRPAKLKRAKEWAENNPAEMTPLIQVFLKASAANTGERPAPETGVDSVLLRDLESAFRLQTATAKPLPVLAEFGLGRYVKPVRYVSGDLAEFELQSDGTLAFWLADCSGKGVSAAIYSAILQGLLRGSGRQDPSEVLPWLNRRLCELGTADRFAQCLYGVLDPHTRMVRCGNAGAPRPVLATPDRTSRVDVEGLPLGLFPEAEYQISEFRLEPRNRLALFTDGLSEAENPRTSEEFGEERMFRLLSSFWTQPAIELAQRISSVLEDFAGDRGLTDDASLLLIQAD